MTASTAGARPYMPSGLGWMIPGDVTPTWAGRNAGDWLGSMLSETERLDIGFCHLGLGPSSIARLPALARRGGGSGGPRDLFMTLPSTHELPSIVTAGEDPVRRDSQSERRVRLHVELPLTALRGPEGMSWADELRQALGTGRIASWGIGLPAGESIGAEEIGERAADVPWVRVPYNLLSPHAVSRVIDLLATGDCLVYASDPFAGGRLDGSFLSESYLEGSPGPGAPMLTTLKARWAPVLRLGFLTARAHRTLPGAALAFLRDRPEIRGVFADAADAADVAQLANAWTAVPFSPTELERLERLSA